MSQTQRFLNSTISNLYDNYVSGVLTLLLLIFMLLSSNSAFAESDPVCPSGHAMYYLGSKTTTTAPKATLSWSAAGSSSTTYSFDSGLKLVLSFSDINFVRTGYPEVSSFAGVTTNALNMRHSSERIDLNHKLTATINKPVTKYGFVVQDLDANAAGRYTESVSIVTTGGSFSNFGNNFTVSNLSKTITANQWTNCSPTLPCNFNIEWEAQSANTPFVTTHGNPYSGASTTASTGDHLVGYSDFYFCLAPPKLIVKKALSGTRVNTNDQFEIAVSGGSVAANSFTTTGTGSTITNGTSATITLAESTNYTITERVMNGTTLGDIANYNATYVCSNATTGSTTVMPTSAMNYSASAKTRSFALNNVANGDEITCTITNTPSTYTFSGIVFDDNGGITSAQASATNADITSGVYANNSNYFNGIYNPTASETGISGSTVKLVNCTNTSTVYGSQTVTGSGATIGQYQISVSSNTLNGNTSNLCLIEERTASTYPLRTNDSSKTIAFSSSTYDYSNNNFGRVIAENVALVLRKYQYLNDCPSTLTYTSISETSTPNTGFSTATISNIEPGRCIAYKISATNRANVNIDSFIMRDTLQQKGTNGATVTSVLANPALSTVDYTAGDNPAIGASGEIKTKTFVLSPRTKRDFYFNTKYGTTQ
ncbi:hypothetical protein [Psychrobacter sp. NG27]|uniref:hypothetical protein n=1 Tax=Psychrobacter sp. NG27 TaxID=2781966 RepID=UPI0018DF03A8|nr:hypothetical protein [Psychrobacter sp. NG27]MBI0425392.1 hypothetical protein [Psychrobacter sp. NG27]